MASKISVPDIEPVGKTTSPSPVPSVVIVSAVNEPLPIVKAPATLGKILPPAVIVSPPEDILPAKLRAPPESTGI